MNAPRQAVELYADEDVHSPRSDISEQRLEGGPLLLRPRDAMIHELRRGPAAGCGKGPEREQLVLGCLACGRDAGVERRFGHDSSFSVVRRPSQLTPTGFHSGCISKILFVNSFTG